MVNIRKPILENPVYLQILHKISERNICLIDLYRDFDRKPKTMSVLQRQLDFLSKPDSFKDGAPFLIKENMRYKNRQAYSINWAKFIRILIDKAREKNKQIFDEGNKFKWPNNEKFDKVLQRNHPEEYEQIKLFNYDKSKDKQFLWRIEKNKYLISFFKMLIQNPDRSEDLGQTLDSCIGVSTMLMWPIYKKQYEECKKVDKGYLERKHQLKNEEGLYNYNNLVLTQDRIKKVLDDFYHLNNSETDSNDVQDYLTFAKALNTLWTIVLNYKMDRLKTIIVKQNFGVGQSRRWSYF